MRFYVYALIDPRNGQTFYIGKGQGARMHHHEREARSGRLSRKCDRIREIWAAGLEVEKRKVEQFDCEQSAYDYEEQLIEEIGLANLTNLVHGGRGGRGGVGPTYKADRDFVRAAAGLMARCRPGMEVYIGNRPLGLESILKAYRDLVAGVVERRGLDWVNNVANVRSVVFAPDFAPAPNI
jgi:hypothetical protein